MAGMFLKTEPCPVLGAATLTPLSSVICIVLSYMAVMAQAHVYQSRPSRRRRLWTVDWEVHYPPLD